MSAIDTAFLIERTKKVITDPVGVWQEVASETSGIKEIYTRYVIPMAAIPVICEFIKMVLIGQDIPFIGTIHWSIGEGIYFSILRYVFLLAGVYLGACVIEFLSPKFSTNVSKETGVKLLAYAAAPSYVGGVFSLFPWLGFVSLVLGLYSLYVLFQGFTVLTQVEEAKKVPFFASFVVVGFVVMVIFGGLVAFVGPDAPTPQMQNLEKIELPGGKTIDVNELQKSMEHLKNSLPKSE